MLCDVVRRRRRRRRWAHAPVIHATSHFDHKKRVAWVSISMHTCGSFLTHSLRSKAKQWMSFCGYGQNGVSKICVDGCDVVSENSGSDVTNWLDLNNR